MKPVRYAYSVTSALLVGGAAISLATGYPAGAQVAQNDDSQMARVVPRAGAPESFADLTAQLQPAVVNISTRQRIEVSNNAGNPFAGTPFEGLFNRRGGQQQEPQYREGQSLGSGFIISADGYVVTNNHVVSPTGRGTVEEITVTMPDGTEYNAELVGTDPQSDLAVLKISRGAAFPYVEFGDSSQARPGDWVVAIGNPFGLGGTVTSGIISSVLRTAGAGAYDRYIQTDAAATDFGIIAAANEGTGRYVSALDPAQFKLGPKSLISIVGLDFGVSLHNEATKAIDGDWAGGSHVNTGLGTGVIEFMLSPLFQEEGDPEMVAKSKEVWAEIEKAKAGILDGSIEVPFNTTL